MNPASFSLPVLERLPSGVPGLDEVLGGGFFQAGVYMLLGPPGSGKTILANQVCYSHVAAGGSAVYMTLLAESHARMLQHIQPLGFFDAEAIPSRLSYLSAFHELETDGLKGLTLVLRREMRARKAGVVVLDGLVAATEAAGTDRELKKFIHEVQTSAVLHGCTIFLLTSGLTQRVNPEHTMVDGIVEMEEGLFEARAERAMQVRKFRGAGSLLGKHAFRITDAGIEVFPRIEARYTAPPLLARADTTLSTGIPSLDALLGAGGLPSTSATLVIGSTGTGKTTLGLHFLAGCSADEPGLMMSFFEPPARLKDKAGTLGLDLAGLEASGALHFIWHPQGEHLIDELGQRLLDAVAARGAKRLVIDGLAAFFAAATFPERINRFFSCLTNELRRRGVTLLMTLETRDAVGSAVEMPSGVSGFVDNLLLLRFAQERGVVRRLLSITKMRDTDYDPAIRELNIRHGRVSVDGVYSGGGDAIPTAEAARGVNRQSE